MIQILALSGSLRAASLNTATLLALGALAPQNIRLTLYQNMADIPPFNPDLDHQPPASVAHLRAMVGQASGLIMCSPEYAHGVSGVLKNTLDWLVSGEEFYQKPVALLNMSYRATHADAQLREILKTMSARLVEPACKTIPLKPHHLNVESILADQDLSEELRQTLVDFVAALA